MTETGIRIERLDHLVLTVRDLEATCTFYERVLGMRVVTFGEGRRALEFGQQKITCMRQDMSFCRRRATPLPALPTSVS